MKMSFLAKMLDALTSAYSRKDYNAGQLLPPETNIGKLFSVFAWGLDSAQEQAELIRLWDDLEYARGSVLDRYGLNFGVKRVSLDDRFYRLAIKVKMMALLSGGDTDTVIRTTAALFNVEPSAVEFRDLFPAKIELFVDLAYMPPDRQDLIEPIAYAIKRILAAGVSMRLYLRIYRTYRSDLTFLRKGYARSDFTLLPSGSDRAAAMPVLMAHGAIQTPVMQLSPPDTRRAHTACQERAGGTIFHTHVKSKRIE